MASLAEVQDVLADTLALLEWRLRRLEFVLNGGVHDEQPANRDTAHTLTGADTVLARVRKLEQALQQLSLKSGVVSDLLTLRMLVGTVTHRRV